MSAGEKKEQFLIILWFSFIKKTKLKLLDVTLYSQYCSAIVLFLIDNFNNSNTQKKSVLYFI